MQISINGYHYMAGVIQRRACEKLKQIVGGGIAWLVLVIHNLRGKVPGSCDSDIRR
jgi:hypothetical protein